MYGTRDAAHNWEETYSEALESAGFVRGLASPCIFRHEARGLKLVVHGDDFLTGGPVGQLRWLASTMDKRFECKHKIMGAAGSHWKNLLVLNRVVEWESTGITISADSKHARLIVEHLGLEDAKSVVSPGIREINGQNPLDDGDLDEELTHQYRSIVARCNYLAPDRPDIQFSTRECATAMSKPKHSDLIKLKRIGRYLIGKPSSKCHFEWQSMPKSIRAQTKRGQSVADLETSEIMTQTDSDWAGNRETRKSVSGGAIYFGRHLIRAWSKEQPIIALSSGEAELYAANFGSQQSIGLRSVARDMAVETTIRIEIDASAAKGILERRGLGKTRHIDVQDLWLQERVRLGDVMVVKIPGELNTADMGTKPLQKDDIEKNMKRMGFY